MTLRRPTQAPTGPVAHGRLSAEDPSLLDTYWGENRGELQGCKEMAIGQWLIAPVVPVGMHAL